MLCGAGDGAEVIRNIRSGQAHLEKTKMEAHALAFLGFFFGGVFVVVAL